MQIFILLRQSYEKNFNITMDLTFVFKESDSGNPNRFSYSSIAKTYI